MASEQRERELRDELAVLSDSSMVGLVRIDRSGSFQSANKIWFSIVKLDPSSPLDEWINNMHEDDFEWVLKEWSECVTRSPCLLRSSALTTLVLQSSKDSHAAHDSIPVEGRRRLPRSSSAELA
jgi:PAS domain-containing protein